MKQVTKYEANDGELYDTEVEALAADQVASMVAVLDADCGAYGKCSINDAVNWFIRTYDFTLKVTK